MSIMNGYFDVTHPEDVTRGGCEYSIYDDMVRIAESANSGKVVINLCTDNLKEEYQRIKSLGIGSELTDIRYINAGNLYWYFCLKNDVMGSGLPLYHVDRVVKETGISFGDGSHIIYVNGSYQNEDDAE